MYVAHCWLLSDVHKILKSVVLVSLKGREYQVKYNILVVSRLLWFFLLPLDCLLERSESEMERERSDE